MRIGLVGTGRMGTEVAEFARRRGHELVWSLGSAENPGGSGITRDRVSSADVVFEFTSPAASVANLLALAAHGAHAVCGTTGWGDELARVTEEFLRGGGGLVHSANFSIGVRAFFELSAHAARLYGAAGYSSYIVEEHHAGKRDAPSGTARRLASIVEKETGKAPPVASVRAGTIPGTHRLAFESPEDEVELVHRARGRAGFARGAVWAGERIAGRSGVFEFGELWKEASVRDGP